MKRRLGMMGAAVLLLGVSLAAIDTIKAVRLADGYDDANRIGRPVYDTGGALPVRITMKAAYDRGAKIVRRGATGMFTRGPEYNLEKSVDLAALFADAARVEAGTMGFTSGDTGWGIEGTVKDVYLESKQIPYGATLFYGYMLVDMQIRQGSGAAQTRQMRFHDYYGSYNAGLGRRDEAESALAHLLIEGAQDLVARLNREFFKAPPHPDILAVVSRIQSTGAAAVASDLHRVGLSGAPGAAEALLKWLPGEPDENRRSAIIDALADLASPEAVPVLASRYKAEDEDCRWYSLKAMDYIATDAALALVRDQGSRDSDGGPRRLAERIVSKPSR